MGRAPPPSRPSAWGRGAARVPIVAPQRRHGVVAPGVPHDEVRAVAGPVHAQLRAAVGRRPAEEEPDAVAGRGLQASLLPRGDGARRRREGRPLREGEAPAADDATDLAADPSVHAELDGPTRVQPPGGRVRHHPSALEGLGGT
eukprot:CAMPEP_0176291984 /NCGR_PEP_ID=MMETSP0121_2-20121125/55841_1 /TAXON_ID=160619 /ORGANISM="Kryptoperidinium foliaceum, Strain CCMP 1326" /LENGTH=143 /DNA_ID=CAMNT_0017632865 /DNA_START=68 /DNA_END=495 /DNA_ORIENTATION=+